MNMYNKKDKTVNILKNGCFAFQIFFYARITLFIAALHTVFIFLASFFDKLTCMICALRTQ